MQLQCLSHGPGHSCAADKSCTDFISYCGYTPLAQTYNETTEPLLFKVQDNEYQFGSCRPTILTEAECKRWARGA